MYHVSKTDLKKHEMPKSTIFLSTMPYKMIWRYVGYQEYMGKICGLQWKNFN